jgi:hypothetical protein
MSYTIPLWTVVAELKDGGFSSTLNISNVKNFFKYILTRGGKDCEECWFRDAIGANRECSEHTICIYFVYFKKPRWMKTCEKHHYWMRSRKTDTVSELRIISQEEFEMLLVLDE